MIRGADHVLTKVYDALSGAIKVLSSGGIPPAATNGAITNQSVDGTAISINPPANAVAFILEADSTNTDNLRWCIGATATSSVGMLTEPGRDTGVIPCAAVISVIALSGTQKVSAQWLLSQ